MIRDRKIECMPRDELKKLQSERLCALVARMYDKVELFRIRMDELGLKPGDIKGVEDLEKLPFSYKKDRCRVHSERYRYVGRMYSEDA